MNFLVPGRGAIAAAEYADEMIEAGYDSLDNMIFTKDELQESVASSILLRCMIDSHSRHQ